MSHILRPIFLLTAGLFTLCALCACHAPHALWLDEHANGQTLEVRAGDTLYLLLPAQRESYERWKPIHMPSGQTLGLEIPAPEFIDEHGKSAIPATIQLEAVRVLEPGSEGIRFRSEPRRGATLSAREFSVQIIAGGEYSAAAKAAMQPREIEYMTNSKGNRIPKPGGLFDD